MTITLLHDSYDQDHLDSVVAEMKILGRPSIRVYAIDDDDTWYQAIEGCHRLRACEILGLTPRLVVLSADTPFVDDTNTQIIDWDGPSIDTIGELGDVENYSIEF